MSSRIKRVYKSGRKLKFTIARPDGTPKGAPLQPLPESTTPNLYTAIPLADPEPGDMVMVYPADKKVTWEGKPLYWEDDPVFTEGDAIESLSYEHQKPTQTSDGKAGDRKGGSIGNFLWKLYEKTLGVIVKAILNHFLSK